MKLRHGLLIAALLVTGPGVQPDAYAGFDEGWSAYVDGDYATALREWRALAEQGDGTAQYNIAVMYDTAQGVPQDDVEAYAWYALAESRLPPGPDRDRAKRRRGVVAQFMSRDQIARSEALVRTRGEPAESTTAAAAAAPTPSIPVPSAPVSSAPVSSTPVTPDPVRPKPNPRAGQADRAAPAAGDNGGAFVAHLASVRTETDVRREWQRLRRKYAPVLDRTDLVVQRVGLQGRGTFYRILAGAFRDRPGVERVCASLSAKGAYCAVVDGRASAPPG